MLTPILGFFLSLTTLLLIAGLVQAQPQSKSLPRIGWIWYGSASE